MESIKEKMVEILNENGITVYDENEIIDMDSLVYVSVIVSVEEEFGIEVPDEYLLANKLTNLSDFVVLVSAILE